MSFYPFDGDIEFGWNSFGRSFAIAGALALIAAAMGFALVHGWLATTLEPESKIIAWAMEWVGAGLFAVLAVAAWGSIRISRQERGSVEITPQGVRRILSPGKEEFLPLEQIEGFMARPFGGVLLVDRSSRRDMIIPRGIEGYRDCIAELKALGINAMPFDPYRVRGRKRQTARQKLLGYARSFFIIMTVLALVDICRDHAMAMWARQAAGAGIVVFVLLVGLDEWRRNRKAS